jgi:hypothetical protein
MLRNLPDRPTLASGLVIDFDSLDNPAFNHTGLATPLDHEFLLGKGESGGAYWVQSNTGQWQLASIQSWGTLNMLGDNFGQYGHMAISAKLYEDTVLSWIDTIVPAPSTLCMLFPLTLIASKRRRRATI